MISNKNEFNQNLFKNFNMGSNLEMNMQEWCLWNTPTWLYLSSSQQITATRDNSDKLISLNKEFCSWELLDERKYSASNDFQNLCLAYPTSYPISNFNMGEIIDPVKSRKRSVGLPDIDENLLKILNLHTLTILFNKDYKIKIDSLHFIIKSN